jgi:hypothetical protein
VTLLILPNVSLLYGVDLAFTSVLRFYSRFLFSEKVTEIKSRISPKLWNIKWLGSIQYTTVKWARYVEQTWKITLQLERMGSVSIHTFNFANDVCRYISLRCSCCGTSQFLQLLLIFNHQQPFIIWKVGMIGVFEIILFGAHGRAFVIDKVKHSEPLHL